MSCKIYAVNGQDSLLFTQLVQSVGETRALEVYYSYIADPDKFRTLPKDSNGEPIYEAYIEFIGMTKPRIRAVSNVNSFGPAAKEQINTLFQNWNIEPHRLVNRYGVLGVVMPADVWKKIAKHYQNNPSLSQYSNINFKYSPTHGMMIIEEVMPPEIRLNLLFSKATSYVNNSGGANGYDTVWDQEGRPYGMSNSVHWYKGEKTPLGNREIDEATMSEGKVEAAKAAKRNYGYGHATMKNDLLIRNWAQVKFSDAVFAVSSIVDKGEKIFPDIANDTRLAAVPSVTGGTGYAVGMAINNNKPVFVFNQKGTTKYPVGWYTWSGSDFVKTDTPTLTQNFAGIGSRKVTLAGTQAVKDVYEKTFGAQASTQPVQNNVGTKVVVSSSGSKMYKGKITSLGQNQVFVFGANDRGIHGRGSAGFAFFQDERGRSEEFITSNVPAGTKGGWTVMGEHSKISQGNFGKGYGLVTVQGKLGGKSFANRIATDQLIKNIEKMYEEAMNNPDKEFLVAYSGYAPDKKSLSGYTPRELATLFDSMPIPENVVFEENFQQLVENTMRRRLVTGEFRFEDQATRKETELDKTRLDNQQKLLTAPILDSEGNQVGYFSAEQMQSISGMLKRKLLEYMIKHGGEGNAKKSILEDLREVHYRMQKRIDENNESLKLFEGIEKAQERNNNLQLVINSYDGLFNKVRRDLLEFYGINLKKINQSRKQVSQSDETIVLDENGQMMTEGDITNDEDAGRQVFGQMSEMIDPRDTMTGRVKLFLSTIKQAEYGEEAPVVKRKLPINSNDLRRYVINSATPVVLSRTLQQAREIGIVPSGDERTKVGVVDMYYEDANGTRIDKAMRVTSLGYMTQEDADEFNRSYVASMQLDKEGKQVIAKKGDIKYQIEPFAVKTNVLKDKIGWTGQPEVADMESVFQKSLQSLIGVEAKKEAVFKALRKAGESDGTLVRLVEALEKAPEHYLNEFIAVTHKQNQKFSTVLLSYRKRRDGSAYLETRIFDSNRGSAKNVVINHWKEMQKVSDVVKMVKTGQYLINYEKIGQLKAEMKTLSDKYKANIQEYDSNEDRRKEILEEAKRFVNKVLSANGIVLSEVMLDDLVSNISTYSSQSSRMFGANIFDHMGYTLDGKPSGLLSLILDSQDEIDESETFTQNVEIAVGNFLYNSKDVADILANVYLKHSAGINTQSFRNVNGDIVYAFGHPTYLSEEFNRITNDVQYRTELSKIPYISNNLLLRKLNAQENIRLEYVDGFNKMGSDAGTERSAMSPREQEIDAVNRAFRTKDRGDFYSLTHSDKTRTPLFSNLLRFKVTVVSSIDVMVEGEVSNAIVNTTQSNEALNEMVHLFMSEWKRIQAAFKNEGSYNHARYEQGNKYFYLTPFNQTQLKDYVTKGIISEDEYAMFYDLAGEHTDVFRSSSLPQAMQIPVVKVLNHFIEELTDIQVNHWKDTGFIVNDKPLISEGYLKTFLKDIGVIAVVQKNKLVGYRKTATEEIFLPKEFNKQLTRLLAAEYALNAYVVNAASTQLLYGDPAQFFKKSIDGTLVEYQKRLAGPIAPHRLSTPGPEEQYDAITIADSLVGLPAVNHKAYKAGINIADAQEYITMEEALYNAFYEGQISRKEYDDALNMVSEAMDGSRYYSFSKSLEGKIFGITKPVYYGNTAPVNGDAIFKQYIKSSAFPLYPPFTTGLEIDKLRIAMEDKQIRRAHMESAKKAGNGVSIKVFNEDGTVDVSGINDTVKIKMDRKNLGIQQDNPYNPDKKAIATVSQENKLITSTLDTEAEFVMHDGRKFSAKQVRRRREQVRMEMIDRKIEEFYKEFGIEEGQIMDKKKAYATLAKLAESNGVYADELLMMSTDRDGNPYIHPFFLPSSRKYEQLVLSALKKATQIKITGKSYVQASAAGITRIKEGAVGVPGITWVSDVKELSFITKKDGVVSAAQVLVPFNFFADRKIKLEDVMTDGKVDPEKLPSELLQMVGARIPNQGHNSMLPIEIVGFTPDEMGDVIIVPNGITAQMGSDFDVDKLYVYQRPYEYVDGKFKVPETPASMLEATDKQLEHEYFDIHWAVLTNPDMYDRVINPLDKPDIAEESAKYGKISRAPFFSPVRQLSDYLLQVDAKALVGLSSLATTFNAVIQDKNLILGHIELVNGVAKRVEDPIIVHDDNGNEIVLRSLSSNAVSYYNGVEVRTKHDNITTMQSAFLDNAKDPHTGKLNITVNTWPAAYAIVQLQTRNEGDENGLVEQDKALDLRYVTRLLSQPIIREFNKRLTISEDTLSPYTENTADSAVGQLQAELYKELNRLGLKNEEVREAVAGIKISPSTLDAMHKTAKSRQRVIEQLAVLEKFDQFRRVGRKLIELTSLFNQDTKAAGGAIIQALDKQSKYDTIMSEDIILNTESIISYDDGDELVETEQGYLYGKVIQDAVSSLGLFFPHAEMANMFNQIRQETGKDRISVKQQEEVIRSMKAFIFSDTRMSIYPDDVPSERVRLLFDTDQGPSLAKRIMNAKSTAWGKNNYFIQRLATKLSPANGDFVVYNATTALSTDDINNKRAWTDLLSSADRDARLLGEDLIRYAYITGGVQDNNSFIRYIPTAYIQSTNIASYLNSMHGSKGTLSGKISWNTFKTQYYQHFPERTPRLSDELKEIGKHPGTGFTIPATSSDNTSHLFSAIEGKLRPVPFVHFSDDGNKNRLYQLMELTETEATYKEVDILGNDNIYEFTSDSPGLSRSVLPENRVLIPPSTIIAPVTQGNISYTDVEPSVHPLWQSIGIRKKDLSFAETVDLLISMSQNPTMDKKHSVVAKAIHDAIVNNDFQETLQISNDNPFLSVTVLNNSEALAQYSISSSKTGVNVNMKLSALVEDSIPTEYGANAFLHEFIHFVTVPLILGHKERFSQDSTVKGYSELLKNNPEVEKVMNQYFENYLEVKRLFNNKVGFENLSSEDIDNILYAISSPEEFASGIMTDYSTINWLNSIPDTNNGTLLQKLLNFFAALVESLGKALVGNSYNPNSMLSKSLKSLVPVMHIKTNTGEFVKPSMIVKEVDNRKFILVQDDNGNTTEAFEEVNGIAKSVEVEVAVEATSIPETINEEVEDPKELSKYEIAPGIYMNKEQREAADQIESFLKASSKGSGIREFVLSGAAGTGKTTILKKVLGSMIDQVKFLAPSHNARIELDNALGDKRTLTLQSAVRMILDKKQTQISGKEVFKQNEYADRKLFPGNIIVLDESSMVDDGLLIKLREEVNNEAIIIYTGDHAQLSPVNQQVLAYPFRNTELPRATLIQNMRSEKADITAVIDGVRKNVDVDKIVYKPIENRANTGNVVYTSDVNDVVNSYVSRFKAKNRDDLFAAVMVGYRNKTKDALNAKARQLLFGDNLEVMMPGDYIRIDKVAYSLTKAENKGKEGDIDLTNNERFIVEQYEALSQQREISIRVGRGSALQLQVPVYRVQLRRRISANATEVIETYPLQSGYLQSMKNEVTDKGMYQRGSMNLENATHPALVALRNRMGNMVAYGDYVRFIEDLESRDLRFDYAYAATSHNVQGSSYKHVYVIENDIQAVVSVAGAEDPMRSLYVAVSRARETLTIYHPELNKNVPVIHNAIYQNMSYGEAVERAKEEGGIISSSEDAQVVTYNMMAPPAGSVTSNKTKALTDVLSMLAKERRQIASQINTANRADTKERAEKKLRTQQIDSQIKLLQEQMNLNSVINIARDHLKWVNKTITKPNLKSADAMAAFRMAQMWSNLSEVLGNLDAIDRQGLDEAGVAEITSESIRLRTRMINDTLINHLMSNTTLKFKDITNVEDESFLAYSTRSLNSAQGQFAQTLGKILTDSSRMIDEETSLDAYELEALDKKMTEWGKKNGKSREQVQSLFVRKGKNMLTLVNEFSPAWYGTVMDLRRRRDKSIESANALSTLGDRNKLIKQAYQEYWSSINSVSHTINLFKIVDVVTGNLKKGPEYDKEFATLQEMYGSDPTPIINRAVEQYQKYLIERDEFFLSVDTTADQRIDDIKADNTIADKEAAVNTVNTQFRVKEKAIWVATNSPLEFINTMNNTSGTYENTNRGDKFTVIIPNRKKMPQYYDNTFQDILNDKELKEIYSIIQTKIQKLLSLLPYDETKNLVPNFFPQVKASMINKGLPIGEQVKNFLNAGVESISANSVEEWSRGDKLYKDLPINYLHARANEAPFMSDDISRVLEVFSRMAHHFRHMSEVKDIVDIGETLLVQHNIAVANGTKQGTSIKRLLEVLEYTKDHQMYRQAKRLQGNTKFMLFDTTTNAWNMPKWIREQTNLRKQWDELTVKSGELDKQLRSGQLTQAEYDVEKTALNKQIEALRSISRTVYGSKVGDKLILIQQAKALSYNPFSAFANWSFGIVSALNYAQGARGLKQSADYDNKTFRKGWAITTKAIRKFMSSEDSKSAMKIYRMMELTGVMGDVVDSTYGETALKTRRNKVKDWMRPYEMMRSGDYNVRASVLVAMMMYRKAKVKNLSTGQDEFVSIWDLYDNDGMFKASEYEAQDWNAEDITERVSWNKFKSRANKVMYTIMGNTDKNASKLLKKGIWGRLIAQFRLSWIPEGVASRLAGKTYDQDLERYTKGRWQEIPDMGIGTYATILGRILLSKIGASINPFEGLTMKDGSAIEDYNEANMYRNFSGLIWTLGISASVLMMKALADDDDEKNEGLMVLINTLTRLQQDLLYYSSSEVMVTLTRSPIPALNVLVDYQKAMSATYKAIVDDEYDWDQAALKWTKAGFPIPQAALINKVKFMTTRDLSTISR